MPVTKDRPWDSAHMRSLEPSDSMETQSHPRGCAVGPGGRPCLVGSEILSGDDENLRVGAGEGHTARRMYLTPLG